MKVEARYMSSFDGDPRRYTFNVVHGGVQVGDVIEDAGQTLIVTRLESDYNGPVRNARLVERAVEQDG